MTQDIFEFESQQDQRGDYLEAILDNAADGIVTIDGTGTILSINPAGYRMFGYEFEEMIGLNIGILMPQKNGVSKHDGYLKRHIKTGHTKFIGHGSRSVVAIKKNREIINIRMSISSAVMYGEPIFIGIMRDVTEMIEQRKSIDKSNEKMKQIILDLKEAQNILTVKTAELERSNEKYKAIAQSAPNAIIATDSIGMITSWNRAAERIFGWTNEEVRGKPLSIIMSERYKKQHDIAIQHIATDLENKIEIDQSIELEAIHKDGSKFPIELSISSWWVGDEVFFGGIARDITERIKSQEDRQQYISEMEFANHRLEEQGKALIESLQTSENHRQEAEDASVQATLANKSKSEFLANMSHELRTPLNAVIGFSEMLETQNFGELNERQMEYAGFIKDSGHHLLAVITDILDLSKVEAGKLELRKDKVCTPQIFKSCITVIGERAHEKKIEIEIVENDEICFIADEIRIKQVILNLLSNAVKFTDSGGKIKIVSTDEGDQVRIAVIDNGIGMDEMGLEKALAKFGQVDGDLSRAQEGTELGLPLSKELVELHGGTLTINSEIGEGTIVTVILPKK